MRFILALDQGTTSSRAIVVDRAGRVLASAQQEFTQYFPRPGWVEHDPEEIWDSQLRVARAALRKASIRATDLAAIGITNQRETTIVWDRKTGRPIHNAIVWQDRRTAPLCEALKSRGLEMIFRRRTGLVLDPYFSGTKIRWILDHIAGARRLAQAGRLAFGTVDSWLAWKLSGGRLHITDDSNASRTLLYNLRTGDWDETLLRHLKIPRAVLPQISATSAEYGAIDRKWLGAAVPLGSMVGDQQAALFGQLCTKPGMVKNTYGTGCFMLMHTGAKPVLSRNRLLTTVAWRIGSRTEFALEGSVFMAGATVQWLRDALGIIKTSHDIERLAATVPDAGGVVFVPAFAGLGAPYWDSRARGTIVGLTRGATAAHLARAALDGIAHQVADVLDAMQKDAHIPLRMLRVDGGASVNNGLMQRQADLLGIPVVRPRNTETTAMGAAFLAGLSVGFWKSRAELAQLWKKDRSFKPALAKAERKSERTTWAAAVEKAKGWERL
jgi:glycerol kinase